LDAELKQEISAAVEKSLPKHLSETLQKRLADLEGKERELETTRKTLASKTTENQDLQAKINKLESLVKSEEILEKKAREVEKREQTMEIFELKAHLDAAEKTNGKVMDLVAALMRNTEFKRTRFTTFDQDYRGNGDIVKHPQSVDETETAE
jgi:uncharacterized protein YigA (DUF484 family)